ncbi:MAG: phosphatase PAP2 family protein [Lachnospiraceae bacterium]|nr:phosphatase PAP2 family protein [Lachnospiraceae bacterium]
MEAQILLFIQNNMRTTLLDPLMMAITGLGNAGIFWIILTAVLLIFKKTRRVGLCCAAALAIDVLIVNAIVKPIVARVRPYDVIEGLICMVGPQKDPSFPSGHTASSFAAAFALFLKIPKKFGIPALLMAALIGFSRLYVGVHYPTDVLFGMIFGILIAILAVFIMDRIFALIDRKRAAKKEG